MRVATWNVNSVKQRLPRLLPWLDQRRPDVVCLQETKLADQAFAGLLGEELAVGGGAGGGAPPPPGGRGARGGRAGRDRGVTRGGGAPGVPPPAA
ncbi:endonuclease/exonuclease/phosphatase family protein, partial [Nonomuraea sp. NPDC050547]|uniref:endonuclease/exonuclease/phosphatase family protein n=1 Tax=Nonomuraea sp. NPDC050547 TaxID=3364368 RepID=UPI0037A0330D